MRIDRSTRVLLDASCLVAAARNPIGGSGLLVTGCQRGYLRAVANETVLRKAERNIAKKLGVLEQARFQVSLMQLHAEIVSVPPELELQSFKDIVGANDGHVLASALAAETPYLISLDKRLIAAVNNERLSVRAFSPGDFIRVVLPDHPDYLRFRD